MLPIAVALAFLALIAAIVFYVSKQNKRTAGFLDAARTQALRSNASLEYKQGKNPSLTLRRGAAGGGQFEVRREGAADRLVEGLDLSRRIRTSDPGFGDRFHIDSDDEPFASAFFSDAGKRAAVEALFALGFTSVVWDAGNAAAVWQGFQPKDENAEFVGAAASALQTLARDVPPAGPASIAASGLSEKQFRGYTGKAILVGFIAIYAVVLFHRSLPGRPVDGFEVFDASLRVSVPLAVLFVLGGLSLVRGKSWFLKAAMQLVLASALLFPTLGYVGYAWANSFFDSGPAVSRVLPVVEKHRDSGKHPSYYVCVASWRPGRPNERFEVDYAVYAGATAGRTRVHLTTRPGGLGHEWIVALDFSDS